MFKKLQRRMMPPRGAVPARLTGRPMPPAAPAPQLINNRNPLPAGYDASKYTAAGKSFYGMKEGGEVPKPVVPSNKGGPNRRRGPRNVPNKPDMGQKMREAYENFQRSPESDSPGFKKGGKVSSASKRADGCAMKGKTKGKFV